LKINRSNLSETAIFENVKEIEIRKAEPTDAKVLYRLIDSLGYTPVYEVFEENMRSILQGRDHFLWLAIYNREVVGFIHAAQRIQLSSPAFTEIVGLSVNPEYHRKGIATELIRHLTGSIRFSRVRVRCNTKREAALQFYNAMGFENVKIQEVLDKVYDL
jgi:ribosomal protein S18 acetylase RimI-like enzyme